MTNHDLKSVTPQTRKQKTYKQPDFENFEEGENNEQ